MILTVWSCCIAYSNTNSILQIKEIIEHKALLLETLVQWYFWFVSCLLFYFLNYGWGSFGDTPYVNYLFAGNYRLRIYDEMSAL